jgi:beta-lactamase superfamily II metal-dependent hydrolase
MAKNSQESLNIINNSLEFLNNVPKIEKDLNKRSLMIKLTMKLKK